MSVLNFSKSIVYSLEQMFFDSTFRRARNGLPKEVEVGANFMN